MNLRLLKLPAVQDVMALGPTSIYAGIKDETITPPIKLTERSSAWVESEIQAIVAARVAGKTDAQIRDLVRSLVSARAALAPSQAT